MQVEPVKDFFAVDSGVQVLDFEHFLSPE